MLECLGGHLMKNWHTTEGTGGTPENEAEGKETKQTTQILQALTNLSMLKMRTQPIPNPWSTRNKRRGHEILIGRSGKIFLREEMDVNIWKIRSICDSTSLSFRHICEQFSNLH